MFHSAKPIRRNGLISLQVLSKSGRILQYLRQMHEYFRHIVPGRLARHAIEPYELNWKNTI